jgi:hypothetical protein
MEEMEIKGRDYRQSCERFVENIRSVCNAGNLLPGFETFGLKILLPK